MVEHAGDHLKNFFTTICHAFKGQTSTVYKYHRHFGFHCLRLLFQHVGIFEYYDKPSYYENSSKLSIGQKNHTTYAKTLQKKIPFNQFWQFLVLVQ